LAAERQAIGNRLPPVRSPADPDASIRRRRASHRPTCQGRVGSASRLCCLSGGRVPFNTSCEIRGGETCALRERKPPGRETDPRARFRSGFPTRWARGRHMAATGSRQWTSRDDCDVLSAGALPDGTRWCGPIWVYLCDLWAFYCRWNARGTLA